MALTELRVALTELRVALGPHRDALERSASSDTLRARSHLATFLGGAANA